MYFTYIQHNSGGDFDILEEMGIGHIVIFKAKNAKKANELAESIGMYFNGVADGFDCPCCGDRWYPLDDADSTKQPEIYGKPVNEHKNNKDHRYDDIFIHHSKDNIEQL